MSEVEDLINKHNNKIRKEKQNIKNKCSELFIEAYTTNLSINTLAKFFPSNSHESQSFDRPKLSFWRERDFKKNSCFYSEHDIEKIEEEVTNYWKSKGINDVRCGSIYDYNDCNFMKFYLTLK